MRIVLNIRRIFHFVQCCNVVRRKMKVQKKIIGHLKKCYSIAPLYWRGQEYFLVAAEKQDPCFLFDREGNRVDTVWEGPGGVMSMAQIPASDGVFLTIRKFYSPNDSKDAEIAVAFPQKEDGWGIKTLIKLPHVHRFDILKINGINYMIACTLKSGHEYKNDWSAPGKIYGAVLPGNLKDFEEGSFEMEVLKDGLLKNHGFYKIQKGHMEAVLIASDEGVFNVTPPVERDGSWQIEQLSSIPASDAVLVDMDGDKEPELVYIAPFHGNKICFSKKIGNTYRTVYTYEQAEFAHAIYGGDLLGKPSVVIGHREGRRDLLAFTYNHQRQKYEVEILDHDCGPANVFRFQESDRDILISANREIDEIAMYILSE